jgi:RPN1 N-terminal domain
MPNRAMAEFSRQNVYSTPDICRAVAACNDPLEKKQLCYLLARQGVTIDIESGPAEVADEALREQLQQIMRNAKLSEMYLSLARDLDVMEPKAPDEVRLWWHGSCGVHCFVPSQVMSTPTSFLRCTRCIWWKAAPSVARP